MNIFATDADPEIAAINLDDIRVNKLMLESAQMLSMGVAFHMDSWESRVSKRGHEYRSYTNAKCPELMKPHPIHMRHPCTKWVRATRGNYEWLLEHLIALNRLYTKNTDKEHATKKRIPFLKSYMECIPAGSLQDFQNSTSCHICSFKHIVITPIAYQMYLSAKWDTDVIKVTWKNRKFPKWYELYSWEWLTMAENVTSNIHFRDDALFIQRYA